MTSPALGNPAAAKAPAAPASSQSAESASASWSKVNLPGLKQHPHTQRNLVLVEALKALCAGLFCGLSGGASVLLAATASMTKGKAPAPPSGGSMSPLVSSGGGEDLLSRGCVSSSAKGHSAHSGMT